MAASNPGQTPTPPPLTPQPHPSPSPAPAPGEQPRPPRDPNAPPAPAATDAELKARTDKEIAERVSSPPEQPTPTQEEADAIKTGEYDPLAPEGERVKKKAMEPAASRGSYTTR